MFLDDITIQTLTASLRGHNARNTALANNIAILNLGELRIASNFYHVCRNSFEIENIKNTFNIKPNYVIEHHNVLIFID